MSKILPFISTSCLLFIFFASRFRDSRIHFGSLPHIFGILFLILVTYMSSPLRVRQRIFSYFLHNCHCSRGICQPIENQKSLLINLNLLDGGYHFIVDCCIEDKFCPQTARNHSKRHLSNRLI